MLNKKRHTRVTANECLNHEFFESMKEMKLSSIKGLKLDPDIFIKLTAYKGISTLKKAALNLIVKSNLLKPSDQQ